MTSGKVVTTVGYEKRYNEALHLDRAAFIDFMNKDLPIRPANIANIVAINQGKRPHNLEDPTPVALTAEAVRDAAGGDAVIVDTRTQDQFGAGHIAGSYNVQLSSSEFEQRVAWIIPQERPIVLVLERDAYAERALRALAFVGLENRVIGHLEGGVDAWPEDLTIVPQLSVTDVAGLAEAGDVRVLDVRELDEWNAGHVAGAVQCSFKQLEGKLGELAIEPVTPLAVVCAGGFRSSTAISILLRNGFTNLRNTSGGMDAWQAAGLPTEA